MQPPGLVLLIQSRKETVRLMKQIWALLCGGSETQEIRSNGERGDEEIESEKRGTGRTGQDEVKLTDQRARLPTGRTDETPNS
ncbi:hypothetical protein OsJ_36355 [Oryza sativa Japonica Group]|uniref:Uncharacterized protein n=1 Tax=Oryza sativa subsp. japonica TaxID=39947 RepID=B9GDI3_ORYSJ|nr:hypothetical protein OsJ_36355 [Oryza sativa Japonica Group]